ncbi:MAG: sugar dehydrogenase complex small subunit [Nitrospirales bacterium]|nr:sorbitol dehydrogenase family protein [Nitrospirales bacterium]
MNGIKEDILEQETPTISRRSLLYSALTIALSQWLSGCSVPFSWFDTQEGPKELGHDNSGLPQGEEIALRDFLILSAVITGVDELDFEQGQRYLNELSLQNGFGDKLKNLSDMLREGQDSLWGRTAERSQTSQPKDLLSLDALTQIMMLWYSGGFNIGSPSISGDVTHALTWQVLTFANPPTVCEAYMGSWAEKPELPSRTKN